MMRAFLAFRRLERRHLLDYTSRGTCDETSITMTRSFLIDIKGDDAVKSIDGHQDG